MAWEITHDAELFHAAAGDYLAADPLRSTVLISVADRARREGPFAFGGELPARFGWWRAEAGGPVLGAYVHTPPNRPNLGPMPTVAARALALKWRSSGIEIDGVAGGTDAARSLALEWTARQGRWSVFRKQRLYRLDELLLPPMDDEAEPRLATVRDVLLVARWFAEFAVDIGEERRDFTTAVGRRVRAGQLALWQVAGEPVAMAGFTAVVLGQGRVSPVYTPPELRGRGYAAGATAAASAALMTAGAKEVLLFTDLANPTSNALYQRLGYRPVDDWVTLDFRP
ncbi:GNAT family N-acetyltransferase [Streptacidiphilus sp. N1-12]|uniref:GNAT family N-acetyltransferase n=2 Tax=Streptacidiphilus alkalitolerans TaxID=3342712 RepID=A0ABV6VGM4_9ACTN